ncbi:glycoside hydrolase family 2 protein [Engelhardtia mirabilis]|uniref:beta-mannosidase n=1 Tax=Engelhardtia mirabilis TaxID=2528011 RepID=A0A518BIQ6_9BACT|nr:Exo-beta-D-glucosaminidase precursor [Planctomycetes bacterium Pla133]QDV01159.1 Exo-beta-D-glucosaminidase precursor [Planctomycetes bacterium Pla86]
MSANCSVEVGGWTLRQAGRRPRVEGEIAAVVPGSVQASLLAAGLLPPLEEGLAELDWQWVPRATWSYRDELAIPAELAAARRLRLRFGGLDTLAQVRLGRRDLGRTDNAMRTWDFDLTGSKPGTHALRVDFEPIFAYLTERDLERNLPAWGVGADKDHSGAWVRKPPVHFGWDFAPKVVPVGITGSVWLEATDLARIDWVRVDQEHRRGRVDLRLGVELDRVGRGSVVVTSRLSFAGESIAEATATVGGARSELGLRVDDPRLWWPRGLGDQPLYDLEVVAHDRDGAELDRWSRRIGLRRLELERRPDADGEGFAFVANGRRFFARGSNIVPPLALPTQGGATAGAEAALVDEAAAVHMNCLRVWGGGPYASDAFYDRCDELGLIVWQDFPFACCTYPTFDREWMANVRAEATEHVRRLQHRASLALWCGNNELENGLSGPRWTDVRMSWSDYRRLFDRLLPEVVTAHDGTRPWWPGSPHSPSGDRMAFNSPDSGDAHLWGVWHGGEPFESQTASRHRFVSEFGFQSFPAPATFNARIPAAQRRLDSDAVGHRQRSGVGTARLLEYLRREHRLPRTFADQLWLTQILQAEGMLLGIEHWRRSARCSGALLWQLNEPWAAPTWSTIDRDGRWKALHFALARAFAPRAMSLAQRGGRVEVWALDDGGAAEVEGNARLWKSDGDLAREWSFGGQIGRSGRGKVWTLDLAAACAEVSLPQGEALLAVDVTVAGESIARPQLAKLVPWREVALGHPNVRLVEVARENGRVRVRVSCDRPAPWTFVQAGAGVRGEAPRPIAGQEGGQFLHLFPDVERDLVLETRSHSLSPRSLQSLT